MEEKDDMPDFFKEDVKDASVVENESFEQAKERLNFDISEEKNTDVGDMQDDMAVPYDFRADQKDTDTDEEESSDGHFVSLRVHAIGIGILIGVLLAILLSVFLFGSSDNDANVAPIVIEGSTRATKVRPANPAGMEIPDQDKTVYTKLHSDQVATQVEVIPIAPEAPVQPQVKTKEGAILGTPQPSASAEEMEEAAVRINGQFAGRTVRNDVGLVQDHEPFFHILAPLLQQMLVEREVLRVILRVVVGHKACCFGVKVVVAANFQLALVKLELLATGLGLVKEFLQLV